MRSSTRQTPRASGPSSPTGGAAPVGSQGFRPRRSRRLSTAALLPLVLALLAAVFAYEALLDRSSMSEIVVARAAVPVGQQLMAADTRVVRVHTSDLSSTEGLLKPADLRDRWFATVDLEPGEPLTVGEVTATSQRSSLSQMSIPVPQDQAVGGGLVAGDLVDVIAVGNGGGAHYVARELRVLSVAAQGSGGVLGGSTNDFYVVVAVDHRTALALAAALAGTGAGAGGPGASGIDVVRSSGGK